MQKEINTRWNKHLNTEKYNSILNYFKIGYKDFDLTSIFGSPNDNLKDFRGIDIKGIDIRNCKLENIDFSHSNFSSTWIENSYFNKCYFENTNFKDFADHGNMFLDCYFINCKFNSAAIGYKGTRIIKSIFNNCSFSKTIFIRPEFFESRFMNIKLQNIDFNGSSFENCEFEGHLNNIWFRGGFPLNSDVIKYGIPKLNEMKNVSFLDAKLNNLTFSDGCKLDTLKIKNNNYYIYNNWNSKLRKLKVECQHWTKNETIEANIFVESYLVHAINQDWVLLNINDIEHDFGAIIASKIISFFNSID